MAAREFVLQLTQHAQEASAMVVAQDAGWAGPLEQALAMLPARPGTMPTVEDLGSAEKALHALWIGRETPLARLQQAFLDAVPAAIASSQQDAFDLGICLSSAEDPSSLPPVRQGVVLKAWDLSGWARRRRPACVKMYERALAFLDELNWESNRWKTPGANRLDACITLEALVTCQGNRPSGRMSAGRHSRPTVA